MARWSFHGLDISIHALLAESDGVSGVSIGASRTFLSTLSLRRATVLGAAITAATKFLSTLSLRRATTAMPAVGVRT